MRSVFGDTCSKTGVKLRSSSLETMGCNMRAWVVVVLVASNVFICDVYAAGECGKTPIRSAAASLSPCLGAAGNARAAVPPSCCSKVAALIKTAPKCLCAIMLSPLAKQAGIKPGIALTIPKRCSIKNRQAGKKCGKYTLP
ncbi:NON-SPECIFIC LIPID-TRANSFER PROTEIN 4.1 [Salix purpurea]|uniref:NON-SPECIFIC LIPID-TRANSFER PROTEIN 4.1 n=1 Tax=Salix purpurea TaxID=77065 RepID=A0A9Q0Z2L4_SALPP|nr:NON-SPECIFIC LIPID-TRANSFER PROTEIN 4.1 [Salix purpurea]